MSKQSTRQRTRQERRREGEFRREAERRRAVRTRRITTVGIAPDGSCFYWLHTHSNDGVIHIEAPSGRSFTLGNFLDIWGKRFAQLGYPSELDQSDGWQAYINGKPFAGDFHTIPLQAHTLITLAYHSPGVKPDTTYDWNGL